METHDGIGFIESKRFLTLHAASDLNFYLIKYSIEHYHPDLYSIYNIRCPAHIGRSVEKRQADYLAGRLCADFCLRDLGYHQFDLATHAERFPVWPAGVVGSLSHNSEFAVACTCYERNTNLLGLDIERVLERSEEDIESLSKYVLTPPELNYLHSVDTLSFGAILTLVFSAKESIYKAFYPKLRRFFDFDMFEIVGIESRLRGGAIAFRPNESIRKCVDFQSPVIVEYLWVDKRNVLTYLFQWKQSYRSTQKEF